MGKTLTIVINLKITLGNFLDAPMLLKRSSMYQNVWSLFLIWTNRYTPGIESAYRNIHLTESRHREGNDMRLLKKAMNCF